MSGTLVAAFLGACASAAYNHSEVETVSGAPEPIAHFFDGMEGGAPSAVVYAAASRPDVAFVPQVVRADGGAVEGGGVAVVADASAASGELAWLAAHIADTPDRLRSDDSDNTRQLAARGEPGVRAMMDVFRRGDALRVPFARRVVERVILRQCHQRGRLAIQQITRWLELGTYLEDPDRNAPLVAWTRPVEAAWSDEALARLDRWLREGMACHPPPEASASPSPTPPGDDDG